MWALKPGEKSVIKLMQLKCEHCDESLILQTLPPPKLIQELPTLASRSPGSSLSVVRRSSILDCSLDDVSDVVIIGEPSIQPPKFRKPVIEPVKCSSLKLVGSCSRLLALQTAARNYDRVVFINCFLDHYQSLKLENDKITPIEALQCFRLNSLGLLDMAKGGHCGALCSDLLSRLSMGYLVASKLPTLYQQKGAPELCHVGHLIPFENPEDKLDCGFILLEPGFNIVQPVVLKAGQKQVIKCSDTESWSFIWVGETITALPEPAPTKAKDIREKTMTYRIDELLNPDSAITVPLLAVDARPCILSRDESGQVIAKLIVNFAKKQIELSVGSMRSAPVKFEDFHKSSDWLSEEAAAIFHINKATLLRRLAQLVDNAEMLDLLRKSRM
jgi:hypothetical protein